MGNFLSKEELRGLGLKEYGEDVLIGRHAVLYSPDRLSLGNHVRIDDFTIVSGRVTLKDHIHISQFCGLYGGEEGIVMEDFSGLSSKCSIYAVSDDYTGASMTNPMVPAKYKPGSISSPVRIGKHAIIGCNSVVLPGVTVAEGTAVGSMSLCNKSTEDWSMYVGIPARKKGERKKDILELERQFRADEGEGEESGGGRQGGTSGIYVGQEAEVSRCFTMEDVRQFAGLSGDNNPLHVDEAYAGKGRFGRCVVHGILVSGLISGVLGTRLPGEGSIYLEQNLSFRKPVYVGDTVTARVRVTGIRTEKKIIALETNVYDQKGECVVMGSAKILYEGELS